MNNQLATMINSLIKKPNLQSNVCEFCGKELLPAPRIGGLSLDFILLSLCDCKGSQEAYQGWKDQQLEIRDIKDQVEMQENRILQKMNEANNLLEKSNLGRRFKNRTFETFDKNKNASAYEKAFNYADTFDKNDGQGLLFIGSCGTGKTHLAAAITNHIITEFGIAVKFGSFVDLLADIKKTWSKESEQDEDDMIRPLLDVELLVIDDIGKEKSSEWSNSVLYRVINRRYENYKSTIITSNLSIKELEQAIGEATVSRIIEMCNGIKMDGEDVRKSRLF
jgi:DNA replication protein DnaC